MSAVGLSDEEKSARRRQALANLKRSRGLGSSKESSPADPVGDVEEVEPDSSVVAAKPPSVKAAASVKKVKQLAWICQECDRECVPIRPESRCLCGHRLKDHEKGDVARPFKCKKPGCRCSHFFFIVAEGSWVLRCRCKHKHTDHDPATRRCTKPGCSCGGFDSPWVCNCNHPWSAHKQVVVEREVMTLEAMMAAAGVQEEDGSRPVRHQVMEVQANQFDVDVNRFDNLRRGLD